MLRTLNVAAAVILLVGALVYLSGIFFIVPESRQAVVTQFGRPVRVIAGSSVSEDPRKSLEKSVAEYGGVDIAHGAGLYRKLPFIQRVQFLEDRLLEYDSAPEDVVTRDKKHLLVDNFARWRIVDPLTFLQKLRTENTATSRMDDIVYSVIRETLAKSDLIEIVRTTNRAGLADELKTGREEILDAVLARCDESAREFGIQIVDVRIKRADLPSENRAAVFGRMRAERERVAKRYRSEGEEEAQKIRAETDRDVQIVKAEAYRNAERTKGEGDARGAAIYAEAYGSHQEFYSFFKSLEVINQTITKDDHLIIGLDGGVYKYLK